LASPNRDSSALRRRVSLGVTRADDGAVTVLPGSPLLGVGDGAVEDFLTLPAGGALRPRFFAADASMG
jgi:hypothetical protein